MKGMYLRFRSVRSSGLNPLILRKRKMVRVGIRIVKQYTTPSTISLYCRGMIRRYENTNRIRNAMKGMENGVNITEITLAVLIRVLSVIICCSTAISLFLHYHSVTLSSFVSTFSALLPEYSIAGGIWLRYGGQSGILFLSGFRSVRHRYKASSYSRCQCIP